MSAMIPTRVYRAEDPPAQDLSPNKFVVFLAAIGILVGLAVIALILLGRTGILKKWWFSIRNSAEEPLHHQLELDEEGAFSIREDEDEDTELMSLDPAEEDDDDADTGK